MADPGLRGTFNDDAELYHRRRPGYPPDLLDALFEITELGPDARVLEIGPGTGQATRSLVGRGAHVVAVELGADLAAVLARELPEGTVEVVTAAFEDYEPPRGQFHAVMAFTAWHWLDSSVRASRAAEALRPGGSLATIGSWHVAGGSTAFFDDVQTCYEQWDPATPPGLVLPAAEELPI